jgi:hypothetical protein
LRRRFTSRARRRLRLAALLAIGVPWMMAL